MTTTANPTKLSEEIARVTKLRRSLRAPGLHGAGKLSAIFMLAALVRARRALFDMDPAQIIASLEELKEYA